MKKIKSIIALCLMLLSVSLMAQKSSVNISGSIKNKVSGETLPFVSVSLKTPLQEKLINGTISDENGLFVLKNIKPGDYILEVSYVGYQKYSSPLFIGSKSEFINIGVVNIKENIEQLNQVELTTRRNAVNSAMDKKTYALDNNVSQSGGSVLQSMSNLPGITTQDGQVQLRGNPKVMVLIDGKQTAITGFGNQNGLDNIPASAVDKIEIINNPSAKYDANGNAGIINIKLKKEDKTGFNGKVGLSTGLGALWVRKENLPGIRPQYQATPKINPSVLLNYRKEKVNFFLQADNLYTETLNKNEFVTRTYTDGSIINQQTKRNRNTNFFNSKFGVDWFMDDFNTLTISGLYSQEAIKDYGDQPFFDGNTNQSTRLWQFLEDEVLTAAMASVVYEHKYQQPGHKLNVGVNYTFDREDEKYFFDNTVPGNYQEKESFFLIADQKVLDVNIDYTKPLKHGLLETGIKFRRREIPTNMQFNPSANNSVLDTGADGKATYKEIIPAVYGNLLYEVKKFEAEVGLRIEYMDLNYDVDPNHNTYKSDGYHYFQPFPNARISYKMDNRSKISAFYNRRVDRPDEGDIRIFPKYDDAEIIKVGNPALNPQFTNSFELGYKNNWNRGYFYGATYHKISEGTISRVATTINNGTLIYNTSQNIGKSYNTGIEVVISQEFSNKINMNLNLNGYYNKIDAFTISNLYPSPHTFTSEEQDVYSGNIKWNTNYKFLKNTNAQITAIYLAPDIIPQGTIDARFSLDFGVKTTIQKGKGELFFNATDLLNTMVIRQKITGSNFNYTSDNYYETQVLRLGYSYKF
ncbi:TonB-dependent receptor [Wenyingzhuangia fucanilytica]|uniref:TonB-dependent receptor n=1 Tax=Wenyingzhuangia fucanilytica TaxID=1790137 RepID=A0A1B1Y8N6_9FLAO|nr:TonB-dependent receptor [Wenyingzhuangia fucanilytica]ANW97126.1 TonB-dependent receptor [Wenyingzhuangia fucanilytica]